MRNSDKMTIMMDSGLRSGPDIVRSLESGARFTFFWAYLYGSPFFQSCTGIGVSCSRIIPPNP